jgi:hypothetical protein
VLFLLSGDLSDPGQTLVQEFLEASHGNSLMLPLPHFVLELEGYLMA